MDAAQPLLATLAISFAIVLLASVAFVLTQRYLVTLLGQLGRRIMRSAVIDMSSIAVPTSVTT